MAAHKRTPIKKKPRTDKQGRRQYKRIVPILSFSFICYALFFFLCAVITLYTDADAKGDFDRLILLLGFAAFLSSLFAGLREKKHGLFVGFLTTLPIHLILFMLSFLFGHFQMDYTALFAFVILTVVSLLGGVLGVNHKQSAKLPARHRTK